MDDLFDYSGNDHLPAIASVTATQLTSISADYLTKIWHKRNDEAVKALDLTTQLYRHGANNALSRQFSTNDRMLRNKRIDSTFFTDTFFVTAKGNSSRGNKCDQIFVSDKGLVAIYPMSSKSQFLDSLKIFCKEVGVPI